MPILARPCGKFLGLDFFEEPRVPSPGHDNRQLLSDPAPAGRRQTFQPRAFRRYRFLEGVERGKRVRRDGSRFQDGALGVRLLRARVGYATLDIAQFGLKPAKFHFLDARLRPAPIHDAPETELEFFHFICSVSSRSRLSVFVNGSLTSGS